MPATPLLKVNKKRIAIFLPALDGGGAERIAINLLRGLVERDIFLDLVLADARGPYLSHVPEAVRIVNLRAERVIKAILPLSRYLIQEQPFALMSHMNHANVVAVAAKEIACIKTRVVLVEHNTLSADQSKFLLSKLVPPLMKLLYPRADAIVGVSKGVARDLEAQIGIPEGKVNVVYNPVVDDALLVKAKAPLNHEWFQEGAPPVFLAVGRLSVQKDFVTLIKAFELVRRQRLVRLVILGEGESRSELEEMITSLEIVEDVSLPGFVENPYAYMSRCGAFVLSSRWEGLPTVLIEAMACGCPVISTDCPSGPTEILEGGLYGSLVAVGDANALSNAMLQVLESPLSRNVLIQKAMNFSIQQSTTEYLAVLGCA